MPSVPRRKRSGLCSSGRAQPGPPSPSPRGSPPWTTKSGTTRWKVSELKKFFFARAARADEVSGATSGRRSMTSSPLLVRRRRVCADAGALSPIGSGRAARRVDQLLADSVARERRRAGCARNRVQHGGTDLYRRFEERGEHMFGRLPREDFHKRFRGTRCGGEPAGGL